LDTLLPEDDVFDEDRANRRPTIALDYLLGDAARLERLKGIVADIMRRLRE
jgi:hypothetical protein